MSALHSAATPFPDLVEESLEEAAFLWQRWEGELTSLTRNLDEVWNWTEDRLHGAVEGVRLGGTTALDLASKALQSDELDKVVVCAALLGSSADQGAIETVAAALETATDAKLGAILRGLELLGSTKGLRAAVTRLASRGPIGAAALCRLKTFRRAAPGDELQTAFDSKLPHAQVMALRAALVSPPTNANSLVDAAMSDTDPAVRLAAIDVGLRLGMGEAWELASRLARQSDAEAGPYLKIVALLGTAEDHEVIYAALRMPALQVPAIWALGHIGTVRAAEACLAGMQYDNLAKAAAEAYCWITGADLARDHLSLPDPLPDSPSFEEDDLDANLVPPPESMWPMPDPAATRQHWAERRAALAEHVRYVHGTPASSDGLIGMVENGPLLRRPDLLFELRVRTRGAYDVEARAFADRQRQMMAAGRAALAARDGR